MIADKDLWEDFRNGKRYALSQIYFSNVQALIRYGRRFTRDEDQIRDAIQEVFYSLIKGRENLGSTDNISYYLMASFKHNITRSINKSVNHPTVPILGDVDFLSEVNPEEELIHNEETTGREQKLQQAYLHLPPKQREILYYRFVCEFDYDHICEIMSLKYDSARKLTYRSVKALKEILQDSRIIVLTFLQFVKKV